ncbi:MAG: hypothetical protein K9N47_19740 [Prosthecobacter sp.]|uniref:hypothetical protein n=1 Tax=Prosthecobacter sp. TaxID=1965333 RepID=UPI0025F1B4F8|nr:hypothetical protein [Prosthecobacter sp.]MCF7788364.1 hypothetical protein [Prosthecobacter sp.]
MKTALLLALLAAVFSGTAGAWPTRLYTDAEVTARAELIVIARVKEGSIKKVAHKSEGTYEHHAILLVTRVIKGVFQDAELPITLRYGLLPVAARYVKDMNTRPTAPEEPGEATHIFEDNPSEGYFRPTADVHKNQIWRLHHQGNSYETHAKTLGVLNSEDIQPLTKEDRLKQLLPKP